MARGRKPQSQTAPGSLKVGDRVRIIAEGSTKGQLDAVVEIDSEDGDVRLAGLGWRARDEVELVGTGPINEPPESAPDSAAQAAAEIGADRSFDALVDGAESKVVLDGRSGELLGEEAMIKPSLDDLVRSLARAHEALVESTAAQKRATEQRKDDQGAVNAIVAEIIEHYGHATQLSLGIGGGNGANTAADELEEDEDEELEPVSS